MKDIFSVAMPWYDPLLVAIGPGMRWMTTFVCKFNEFCDSLVRDAGKQTGHARIQIGQGYDPGKYRRP